MTQTQTQTQTQATSASQRANLFTDLLNDWDRQQEAYIAYREQRFEAMSRFISTALASPPKRILDVACGPGSLSFRLLEAFPGVSITAIDKDPVLLRIAREASPSADVEVVSVDLNNGDWVGRLPHSTYDAVVSSTALHWLAPEQLVRVYRDIAGLLPTGGVFLNADHLDFAAHQPILARAAADDDRAEQERAQAAGALGWDDWWEKARSSTELTEEFAEREQTWTGHDEPLRVRPPFHLAALQDGGFSEYATVWQFLNDYVVAGVR